MKTKSLLLICFVLLSIETYSQAKLLHTEQQIREDFKEYKFTTSIANEDGYYSLSINDDSMMIFYYFNSNKVCYATIIIPMDEQTLKYYIERYNKDYVTLSSTKWKRYSTDKRICNIKLQCYDEVKSYAFVWTMEDEDI